VKVRWGSVSNQVSHEACEEATKHITLTITDFQAGILYVMNPSTRDVLKCQVGQRAFLFWD
jgi:Fe-S cluster biosynthesis and repair protein YggX